MSEETEDQDAGAEAAGGGIDPAAVALALSGASREEADAFLHDQRALIAVQKHHLHEQFKRLKIGIFSDRLSVSLKLLTTFAGLAIAAGLALMIWDASHSSGLLIEPFSVPADLASRGLTGETVASQLLDKLTAMQNSTQSARPAQSYTNNWGNDLKVEIPETGISIGDLRRFLREWLGNDTHISGEVWRTSTGIAILARASGSSGETVTGMESDLDDLMQRVAENVYRTTQPYRYANYLDRNTFRPGAPLRVAEAEAIYRRLIYDPKPEERGYAWNGLANLAYTFHGDERMAEQYYRKAVVTMPTFWNAVASRELVLSHPEAALAAWRNWQHVPTFNAPAALNAKEDMAALVGDHAEVLRLCREGVEQPATQTVYNHDLQQTRCATALAAMHDAAATRAWLREMPPLEVPVNYVFLARMRLCVDASLENWRAVVASEPPAETVFLKFDSGWDHNVWFGRQFRPFLALAKARLGDVAGAETIIAATPGDCYNCVRMRGLIASEEKQYGRADYWFGRVAQQAPSIPFAYADWGQALLARGKPDAAIEKFKLANQKGPHFADPLEGWGEALMAKNQSHLALAKFAEAEKYAPNWGRLHLKWGEALAYVGKKDEASAQYQKAATLQLTPADKVELARQVRT